MSQVRRKVRRLPISAALDERIVAANMVIMILQKALGSRATEDERGIPRRGRGRDLPAVVVHPRHATRVTRGSAAGSGVGDLVVGLIPPHPSADGARVVERGWRRRREG
jgi:hypothetical protein